jgi:hypothetical protein
MSVYRPGMDVTKAELIGRTNWRCQEKIESIREWKAKVYEIHNVVFSFHSHKVVDSESDVAGSEQVLPLELDEDDDGFLVCKNLNFGLSSDWWRHNSFIREERQWVTLLRKSVDVVVAIVVRVIAAAGGSDGDTLRLPSLGIGFQHQTCVGHGDCTTRHPR